MEDAKKDAKTLKIEHGLPLDELIDAAWLQHPDVGRFGLPDDFAPGQTPEGIALYKKAQRS
eukprot:14483799-Heterocapsa_arctica.AAC.1